MKINLVYLGGIAEMTGKVSEERQIEGESLQDIVIELDKDYTGILNEIWDVGQNKAKPYYQVLVSPKDGITYAAKTGKVDIKDGDVITIW